MSEVFDDLKWRGLVHQVTDPDVGKLLDHDSLTVYAGFDPSAASLHIGHLLQQCNLRRLAQAGHRPILLAGGGTGLIGDPGGRTEERETLLSPDQIEENLTGIRPQLERFVDLSGGGATLVNNFEWLSQVQLLDFLRDIGKHITVNQMVAKEAVKTRFEGREQGISYAEFSYMLLQAYDFLHLFDNYSCRLQIGGSDQWGNITTGIELIRKRRNAQVYGLTAPLVLNPDGTKMGKSVAGETIWLAADLFSPYRFFQHFLRVDDDQVGEYLRSFTWLDRPRIEELDELTATAPERREAQRVLAQEVTTLVHGDDEARRAEHAAAVLFSEQVAALDERTLLDVFADAPSTTFPRASLDDGVPVAEALASTGLVPSRSRGRDTINQGGAYVNNRRIADDTARLTRADLIHDRYVVLRRGKRDHHLVRFE